MRFFFDRTSIEKSIKKSTKEYRPYNVNSRLPCRPEDDRRGRHTAEDLRKKRAIFEQSVTNASFPVRSCPCDRFTTNVVYEDGGCICTGCGLVFDMLICPVSSNAPTSSTGYTRSILHCPSEWYMGSFERSAEYRRENHLAEVLKQATAMDPPIDVSDLHQIHEIYLREVEEARKNGGLFRWQIDVEQLPSNFIKRLLRPLGAAKIKKYSERWLQIRRYIYWRENGEEEDRGKLLSFSTCERIHQMYTYFVKAFEALKQKGHPIFKYRHNVPFLYTCIRHILHQISPELVKKHKWYFTNLETVGSRLITELRVALMLRYLRRHPEINGGFSWNYQCLLPKSDRKLYHEDPQRFYDILHIQIQQCLKPPKRFHPSGQVQSQTPTQEVHSLLTAEELSLVSFLDSSVLGQRVVS